MPGNFVNGLSGGKMFQWRVPTRAVKIPLSTWGSYKSVVRRKALVRDEMIFFYLDIFEFLKLQTVYVA